METWLAFSLVIVIGAGFVTFQWMKATKRHQDWKKLADAASDTESLPASVQKTRHHSQSSIYGKGGSTQKMGRPTRAAVAQIGRRQEDDDYRKRQFNDDYNYLTDPLNPASPVYQAIHSEPASHHLHDHSAVHNHPQPSHSTPHVHETHSQPSVDHSSSHSTHSVPDAGPSVSSDPGSSFSGGGHSHH